MPTEQLQALIAAEPGAQETVSPPRGAPAQGRGWDVRAVLEARGIAFRETPKPWAAVLELDRCLTSSEHADAAAVFEFPSGALAYRCLHASCAGKGWADVRPLLGLPENASRPRTAVDPDAIRLPSGLTLARVRGGERGGR